mmetsp:Transcript_131593/g.281367  ORF Transcript_131593/g.281367 Transcript_131593/m.281367 type:complete len:148 (-) Transcript_131593:83-526(-)
MARKYQERLAMSSGVSSSRAFESDFGKRILMKYGWQEGQGLGARNNGRVECIQAERRDQKQGLGSEKRKAEDQWDNWWADCFNTVAKRISVTGGNAAANNAAADSDSESDTDDAQAAGREAGRITAVKKAGAMAGKLRRVLRQEKPG